MARYTLRGVRRSLHAACVMRTYRDRRELRAVCWLTASTVGRAFRTCDARHECVHMFVRVCASSRSYVCAGRAGLCDQMIVAPVCEHLQLLALPCLVVVSLCSRPLLQGLLAGGGCVHDLLLQLGCSLARTPFCIRQMWNNGSARRWRAWAGARGMGYRSVHRSSVSESALYLC